MTVIDSEERSLESGAKKEVSSLIPCVTHSCGPRLWAHIDYWSVLSGTASGFTLRRASPRRQVQNGENGEQGPSSGTFRPNLRLVRIGLFLPKGIAASWHDWCRDICGTHHVSHAHFHRAYRAAKRPKNMRTVKPDTAHGRTGFH